MGLLLVLYDLLLGFGKSFLQVFMVLFGIGLNMLLQARKSFAVEKFSKTLGWNSKVMYLVGLNKSFLFFYGLQRVW